MVSPDLGATAPIQIGVEAGLSIVQALFLIEGDENVMIEMDRIRTRRFDVDVLMNVPTEILHGPGGKNASRLTNSNACSIRVSSGSAGGS